MSTRDGRSETDRQMLSNQGSRQASMIMAPKEEAPRIDKEIPEEIKKQIEDMENLEDEFADKYGDQAVQQKLAQMS